ncbi:SMI1/KNR4 family protein [Streptomyces roseifaciens]
MSNVFGAVWGENLGHRFELLPPLTQAELEEAERERGVRLPEEYWTLLQEVGAGDAGPDCGIFPLRPGTTSNKPPVEARDEPFRPEVAALFAQHQENEPTRDGFTSDEGFAQACQDWDTRDDELREEMFTGTIHLSEQGCGYYTVLAVTGPEAGTLWDDVQALGEGIAPKRHAGTGRLTFAQWYLTGSHAPNAQHGKPAGRNDRRQRTFSARRLPNTPMAHVTPQLPVTGRYSRARPTTSLAESSPSRSQKIKFLTYPEGRPSASSSIFSQRSAFPSEA